MITLVKSQSNSKSLLAVVDRARGGGVIGSACIIGLGSVATPLEDVWSDIHSPAPIHT